MHRESAMQKVNPSPPHHTVYWPTCTSSHEASTEAQGFPLKDVFLARASTPPVETENITKRRSIMAHGTKSDQQLSHPEVVIEPNNEIFLLGQRKSTLQAICCQTMLST